MRTSPAPPPSPNRCPIQPRSPRRSQAPSGVSFSPGSDPARFGPQRGFVSLRTVVAPGACERKSAPASIDLTFALGQLGVDARYCCRKFFHALRALGSSHLSRRRRNGKASICVRVHLPWRGYPHRRRAGSICRRHRSTCDPYLLRPGTVWARGQYFTGRSVAEFAFTKWADAPDASRPPLAADVLEGLHLVAQLAPATQGFVFGFKLLWSGTVSDDSLKVLETQDIPLTWQINFGWKAVGN